VRIASLLTATAAVFVILMGFATPNAFAAPAPPAARGQLSGDVTAHDPALVKGPSAHEWYLLTSGDPGKDGGTVQIRRSVDDAVSWTYLGTVWDKLPAWLVESVPGADTMWAPEVFRHGSTYYMYYAASTLGRNNSVIALATNTTLNPADPGYKWVDRGQVIRSAPSSDFNAIDPDVVQDAAGTPWLVFGSYWSGIQMVQLQWPTGLRSADKTRLHLADRKITPNAIEAPNVVQHGGWYYLMSSWDKCCVGVKSTYRIVVGRSKAVTGPYVDRDGHDLMQGGGTTILASSGNQIGPGAESAAGGLVAFHYYDGAAGGVPRLSIRKLLWTADGWPQFGAEVGKQPSAQDL
jgi:arabinan endo-1,5-alpha-L-arabinosidase